MKKHFTLFLLFFTCLKLSANIHHADIAEWYVQIIRTDTPKSIQITHNSKNLNLFAATVHKDSLRSRSSFSNSNSLNLFALGFHKDNPITPLTVSGTDSLKSVTPVTAQKDSLISIVSLHRPDSLKPAPKNVYSGPPMSMVSMYNSNSLKLFSIINQKDSLRTQMSISNSDGIRLFASVVHKDFMDLSIASPHNDRLAILSASHFADSLARIIKVDPDSLKLVALLLRQDTLRSAAYILQLDSLKQRLKTMGLDSVKLQLKLVKSDLFRGPVYSEIAMRYLDYDTISNKRKRSYYQNEAINYTMQALHRYSLYNDTLGLRSCFDNLTTVYYAQRKYSEAKWFILQSNSLSRAKNDVPNIISSLITLAAIKSDIQDYTLAMRDLNEALQLSITARLPKAESVVLKNFGLLYSRLQNYDKEAIVLKKRDSIEDAIRKDEEARLLAKDSVQTRKQDSLQEKKKVYISNIKKLSKGSSVKKTASL